jgi:CelD/BcsL family acetyltransferase involved in cellulose biosynthesis
MNLRVEFVPQDDERWPAFLAHQRPTLFQTPRWCGLIAEEYGFAPRAIIVLGDTGEVVAGLPYAEVEDFRGCRRVTYAFSDVCEPLGDLAAWPTIEGTLSSGGVAWQIRSRVPPSQSADSIESPGMHQYIPLPATVEAAQAAFHQKQRVNAMRLERAGAVCRRIADDSFIEPFYTLYATMRKRKFRLLPQSRKFFERLVNAYFPARGYGLLAQLEGKTLAAMILLSEGDTLYVKYSASDLEARALRPANYLFREAIAQAVSDGYRYLDLGISVGADLQRFKRHLGALSAPYYVARYAQQPKREACTHVESAISAVTNVLTEPDVPLSAAMAAGAVLYRFFV